jgi:hypothetical protein
MVTPSLPGVGTPRSQDAPTAAGEEQPDPMNTNDKEATNGTNRIVERIEHACMMGLWLRVVATHTPLSHA